MGIQALPGSSEKFSDRIMYLDSWPSCFTPGMTCVHEQTIQFDINNYFPDKTQLMNGLFTITL